MSPPDDDDKNAPTSDTVPAAPPTDPFSEMPIPRGDAVRALTEALGRFDDAYTHLERVAMACARALDEGT
jgi:hypothetical protein